VPPLKHISVSSLRTFQRCAAQWEFSYCDGWKKPANLNFAIGLAVDAGVNLALREKRDTGKLPEREKIIAETESWWQSNEVELWPDESRKDAVAMSITLAAIMYDELLPHIKPAPGRQSIQEKFLVELIPGVPSILAFMDVIAEDGIHDIKTSATRYNEKKVAHDLQRQVYGLIYMLETDTKEVQFTFDVGVKLKKPVLQSISMPVTEADAEYVLGWIEKTFGQIASSMKSGHFPPNRESFLCSRRNCQYWRECEKRHGGVVHEGSEKR